jgi:hypothetical protein
VNQVIDKQKENAQVQANMNVVYSLLGEDTQEETSYEVEIAVAA